MTQGLTSDTINCPHIWVGQEKILEWDNADNYFLQCGCIASPDKWDYGNQQVATWIINDKDCENREG